MLTARLLLAAVAGAAAGVSFEPFALAYLLPVAVAALTFAVSELTLSRAFLAGAVFGLAFMLVLLPWLQVIGPDAWVALSAAEGLFYGLVGVGTAAVARLRWWPAWTASLWVGVELLRGSVPFGGFPWGRLAFATADTPVAPLFAYTGAAGATFAVAFVGTVLAWSFHRVRRAPVRAFAGLLCAGLVASVGSALPLNSPPPGEDLESTTIAAVQGNVPGEGMNAFAERRVVLDNHVGATKDLAERIASGDVARPDLVVWPESSTDISPFDDQTVYADIQDAVDAVGVPVLVGAMVDGPEPDEVFNQGIVWSPSTGPGQRYSKNHPVPFGEYIPFRDLIAGFVTRLDQVPRDMRPGTEPGLLEMNGTLVGDVICFEVAYDGLLREVVTGGAEVVVVQTNNATYMGTGQIEQQFAISRLRAIEANRFVVVAATNGVSGVVNPQGDVVERAPVRTQEVLVQTALLPEVVSAGIRFGFWIELLLTLVGAIAVTLGLVRRRGAGRSVTGLPAGDATVPAGPAAGATGATVATR